MKSLSTLRPVIKDQILINDAIAIEEPLEITLSHHTSGVLQQPISITMRTPGHDAELALGFLHAEGILSSHHQVSEIILEENRVDLRLNENVEIDLNKLKRHFYTTSSCGVCGKASISAIDQQIPSHPASDLKVTATLLQSLTNKLKAKQTTFQATGGLHAAALFDKEGNLIVLREDVGRHNAMDKVIGYCLKQDMLPLSNHIILFSGRTSFELVQKSLMAGLRCITAIGAPSSLAIDLSEEYDCTLIGFLTNSQFNLYTAARRVVF